MESLGGSTRRRGGTLGSAASTSRPSSGTAQREGEGSKRSHGGSRPVSAPMGGSVGRTNAFHGGELPGSRKGVMSLTHANTEIAKLRAEEKRQVKERGLWGGPVEEQGRVNRIKPVKPALPPYWSNERYGQPWNDERLVKGADFWQLVPGKKGVNKQGPSPTMEANKTLRKSLETGKLLVDPVTLKPLDGDAHETREVLHLDQREYIIGRMKPHQRIYALRYNLDRDWHSEDFQPWTQDENPNLDREPWYRNMDITINTALETLSRSMRRHLDYLYETDYSAFHAPSMTAKVLLRRAFRKVDPQETGFVSLQQFMHMWENVLNLMEHDLMEKKVNGKKRTIIIPLRRHFLSRNAAAAVFWAVGFNKQGLMPNEAFIMWLIRKDSLGPAQDLLLDVRSDGRNGIDNTQHISMLLAGAKIIYTLSKGGVYAPPDFEQDTAFRSAKPPRATMFLEHVYGYAGLSNLASNLFYTHRGEIAYYVGMIGVVWNKEFHTEGRPSQRFFYGHNNDITCMNVHPSRRFVATGQQTHDDGTPYVCIWDVDTCCQVQQLVHPDDSRSVVAVAFSGWQSQESDIGGQICATVTSDDRHTVRLWRWLTKQGKGDRLLDIVDPVEQLTRAVYIPGWSFGPQKKMAEMQAQAEEGQLYFHSSEDCEGGKGAERPCPSPPFDMENPGLKKSPLDEVYFRMERARGAAGNSSKPKSKRKKGYGVYDERLREWAEWATACQWPETGSTEDEDCPVWPAGWGEQSGLPSDPKRHFLVRELLERPGMTVDGAQGWQYVNPPETAESDKPKDEDFVPGSRSKDNSWELLASMNGCRGTPPQVYGLAFNPFRNSSGKPGCEFLQYGVKHLKVYMKDMATEDGREGDWVASACSFGNDRVDTVFAACYIPACHRGSAKTDACIVAGFASGKIGLFVPPYPTRPGATYTLTRVFEEGHHPGRKMIWPDDPRALPGTQSYAGVRVLLLRQTKTGEYQVLSGGADGTIKIWDVGPLSGDKRGATLSHDPSTKEYRITTDPNAEFDPLKADRIVGMDAYPVPHETRFPELPPSKESEEFVAGTDGNDIWEVDDTPRLLIEGNVGDVYTVATHPCDPHIFATACESDEIMVWDAAERRNIMKASLGFRCRSVAYSQEMFNSKAKSPSKVRVPGDEDPTTTGIQSFHLAVGGKSGRIAIVNADDLRPIVILFDSKQAVDALKYSPAGGPGFLAAGSHDLFIYIYNAKRNYQFVSKCVGHSGTIEHLDWSLPIVGDEYKKLAGKHILQSTCANSEILYWNTATGKQITSNQRDASWETWSCKFGFPVMGMWEDGADRTDVNSVDRSRRGAPRWDPVQGIVLQKTDPESAEWTQGGGYLVTAEDTSLVKLFNFPVVQDDAPYRCFRGHSSHVMCIRFTADDRRVISVGAGDRAVLQWRTLGVNQYDTEYDWAVMEAIEWATQKLKDGKFSKIPKPGVEPSSNEVRVFGGTSSAPNETRADFFESFIRGMYQKVAAPPPLLCAFCHGEVPRPDGQTGVFHNCQCSCPDATHTSLNTCPTCGSAPPASPQTPQYN